MHQTQCNEQLASLLTNDPTVNLLLSLLPRGVLAKPGLLCAPCRGTTLAGTKGYYDPHNARIVLCCDINKDRKDLRDTLVYELLKTTEGERDALALDAHGRPQPRGGLKALFDGIVPKEAEDFARKTWNDVAAKAHKRGVELPQVAEPMPLLDKYVFPPSFISAFLCAEVRSAAVGECANKLSFLRRGCAKKAAVESAKKHLGMLIPGHAEEEVEKVFDKCFAESTGAK